MAPTEWRRHVKAWRQSGQTKRAYTRVHQLSYSRFLYWSNQPDTQASDRTLPGETLLPITITDPDSTNAVDCLGVLAFPNGTKLHIHSTKLLSGLSALLKA